MKEDIRRKRGACDSFPKKSIISIVEITDRTTIIESYNNFLVMIGPDLESKIPESNTNVEDYISEANTELHENPLTEDRCLKAFKSLKINKASGFDKIHVNVINHIYSPTKNLLIRIFGGAIKLGVLQNIYQCEFCCAFQRY